MRTLAIRTLLGAGLALGVCHNNAQAEGGGAAMAEATKAESHVLASKDFKFPAEGSSSTKENSGEMKEAKVNIEFNGQKMDGTMTRIGKRVESWVYLGDNKARRTLESSSVTGGLKVAGQDQPMPEEEDALLGVPVIVEFKDGQCITTLESGATAKGKQVMAMAELNNSLKVENQLAMYGDTPRKVGDKWEVDPGKLTHFGEAKALTGRFTMEFVEIKECQGVPCAVLKAIFDMTGVAGDASSDAGKITMQTKGEAISYRSLADKVDLEGKMTATLITEVSPAPGVTMQIEGPFVMTDKTSWKK